MLFVVVVLVAFVGLGLTARGDTTLINDSHSGSLLDIDIGPNGEFVYAGSQGDNNVSKTNITGQSRVWSVSTQSKNHEDVNVDSNGSLYYTDTELVKLFTDGSVDFTFNPADSVEAVGLSDEQNLTFAGTSGGDLYAKDTETFSTQWSITDVGGTSANVISVVADSDGNVYVGRFDNAKMHRISAGGTEDWDTSYTGENVHEAAISPDGDTVYFAFATVTSNDADTVVALNATDGTERWKAEIWQSDEINGLGAGTGGEKLYVATSNSSRLYALDTADGTEDWNASLSSAPESIVVDSTGGTGYAGLTNGDIVEVDLGPATNLDTSIRGKVTDEDTGNALDNVAINITDKDTGATYNTTTISTGRYEQTVPNGTYWVNASKSGYLSGNKTVTVDGGPTTVDFELKAINETLELQIQKPFLEHGEDTSYEVIFTNATTDTRKDVTGQATVTSNNTSALTVDSANELLEATTNVQVNEIVKVTATYDGKTDSRTIFVGNITINNMDKLPPWGRFQAVIGSGVDGDAENATWLLIMAGAMLAALLGREASAHAGVGAFALVIVAGWVLGKTGDGVLLITLAVVGFVSLNLAANIDYGPVGR